MGFETSLDLSLGHCVIIFFKWIVMKRRNSMNIVDRKNMKGIFNKEVLQLVWGIKLKKVDLSWPTVFSSSQNPSWIELNLSFKPWIELTRALHFWPKVELSCPIIYSSSYNPSWIELNQVNSNQLKAKLKKYKLDNLVL